MKKSLLPVLLTLVLVVAFGCKKKEGAEGDKAAGAAKVGEIGGSVLLTDGPPAPVVMKVNEQNEFCGEEKTIVVGQVGAGGEMENVLVEIEGLEGSVNPVKESYSLTAEKCEFHPAIQMVPLKSKIGFKNADGIDHSFLGWKNGAEAFRKKIGKNVSGYLSIISAPLRDPGVILVKSGDGYKWMAGLLVVQKSPFQALTDAEGKFQFKDVPAGKQKVKATRFVFRPTESGKRLELFQVEKTMEAEIGSKGLKIEFSKSDSETQVY